MDEQKACIYIASSHDETEITNYNTVCKEYIIAVNSRSNKATFDMYMYICTHMCDGHTLIKAIISERQLLYIIFKLFSRVNVTVTAFFFNLFVFFPYTYLGKQKWFFTDVAHMPASYFCR